MDDGAALLIVYDGQCPFCTRYVRLLTLRAAVGAIQLLDARSVDPALLPAWQAGYDLNKGMAVLYGGGVYHGADAVHLLALLSTPSGGFNRINAWMFRSERRAAMLYPALRWGRNMTLRLLGIASIVSPERR